MSEEILARVPDTVLSKPVKIEIDLLKISWLDKILIKLKIKSKSKVFHVTPLSLGTLLKISKELLLINIKGLDPKNLMEGNYMLIQDHSIGMAKIIAIAVVNNKDDPPEKLVDFFLNNLTASELYRVLVIVIQQMKIEDFFRSIISVKGVSILESRTAHVMSANGAGVNPWTQMS